MGIEPTSEAWEANLKAGKHNERVSGAHLFTNFWAN